jgi:hypothetical protein
MSRSIVRLESEKAKERLMVQPNVRIVEHLFKWLAAVFLLDAGDRNAESPYGARRAEMQPHCEIGVQILSVNGYRVFISRRTPLGFTCVFSHEQQQKS